MKLCTHGLATAAIAIGLGTTALSQTAPDWVRFRSISYAGTGCPAGTVAKNIAPDRLAFTLLFDSYVAEAGPAIPFSQTRKNCQINLDLEFPAGWTYTVFAVDYRGFANLQAGVRGTQKSSYYFQGGTGPSAQSTLYGPTQRDYFYRDVFAAQAWSICRVFRSLNINSQVRVDNSFAPANSGVMTVDSIDGQVVHTYGITWRRC